MTYPLLPAALAAERVGDLPREAARRRGVLAALRARRPAALTPYPAPAAAAPQSLVTGRLFTASEPRPRQSLSATTAPAATAGTDRGENR